MSVQLLISNLISNRRSGSIREAPRSFTLTVHVAAFDGTSSTSSSISMQIKCVLYTCFYQNGIVEASQARVLWRCVMEDPVYPTRVDSTISRSKYCPLVGMKLHLSYTGDWLAFDIQRRRVIVRLVLFPIRSGHVPVSGVGETLFLEVSVWLNAHAVHRH